jgi:YggT family protein
MRAARPESKGVGVYAALELPLADAIDAVASFVNVFISVYILIIFAYILTSWIRLPYSIWMSRIQRFLFDVCEPYLRIFRRILPPLGPLDLSPIIAIFALFFLNRVIQEILDRLH